MKYFQILTLFILTLFLCRSEALPNDDHSCVPQSISTSTKLRCGEVLTANSGFISYKPYLPIDKNERCVWTIGFPLSSRYDIDILYLGFPNNDETITPRPSLLISIMTYTNTNLSRTFIPTTTGVFNFMASTLIITLSSGELGSSDYFTGFILQYKRSTASPGSQLDHKIIMPRVLVNFTGAGNNTIGTFVFPPEDNTYPGTPYPIVYLEYGSTTCNTDCTTRLNIFHFDRSNTTVPWQYIEGFCCRQETAVIPGHDDLWMITVTSVSGNEQKDFILFNERCRS